MKPYKTFLILLVFMVFLYGPSLFHADRIHYGESSSIRLPQYTQLFGDYLDNSLLKRDTLVTDSVPSTDADSSIVYVPPELTGIEFSDSAQFYPALIDSLLKDSPQTRILYYGDSQMEGDRITDFLRKELRTGRGGTGPGLISPTMLVPYTRTAYVRTSPNWVRYTYRSVLDGEVEHSDLGPLLSVSRYTTGSNDSTDAWIRISPSNSADQASKNYERLRVFYSKVKDSILIQIKEDRKIVYRSYIEPTEEISEISYLLNSPSSIELSFRGKGSLDLYGISIESDTGVVVDNIPLRGSAGLEFARIGSGNLRASLELLDPELIILHFGLNIVLNIKDDYSYYEESIFQQIEHLKHLCPEAKFLVLGVTDMAREDESGIHSYPNLPAIIDAQRNASIRSGVFFWDSWTAMGGRDAIVSWRNQDPPLASNDYTHISYYGGHKLADMLISAMSWAPIASDTLLIDEDPLSVQDSTVASQVLTPLRSAINYDSNRPLIFTTIEFWVFLFVLLILYSLIFSKPLFRNAYLFIFSLFFYYKSGGIFFSLLVISTLTDYLSGWMIYLSSKKIARKIWLMISLFVNLGMLAYFKYTGFITGAINDLFGLNIPEQDWLAIFSNDIFGTGFNVNSIILPVGISFFTFQTISYTIDVYRNKTKPVKNILDFGFYVSFFPQLVAGPIVRASEFIPQLYQKFSLSKREWSHALFLIISGLIKKIVVSDYLAANFIDNIFAAPGAFSGMENLVAVYAYGLQIYCDFSGYTDIAIGVALMLGFRLPVNFNSPYKAANITDFWRRWHISLSRWLKDYLYISLGGNRKGRIRTYINLFITMLLGGLWHGASWRFIIWGGLHGVGLGIHKIWVRIRGEAKPGNRLGRFAGIFITFNFVAFCWIFFRAENIETVRLILDRIFLNFYPGNLIAILRSYSDVFIVLTAAYIIHFLPARVKESYRGLFIRMPIILQLVIVYVAAVALFNIQQIDLTPFIYFRF